LSGGCELTVVLLDFSAGGAEELSVRCERLVPMTALCLSHSHSADMDGLMPATTLGKVRLTEFWGGCMGTAQPCRFRGQIRLCSISPVPDIPGLRSWRCVHQFPRGVSIGSPGVNVGSPGPKRSGSGTGNTLKRWLTSPVRRLSQGKADSQGKKPPLRTRRRDNRPELTTPLTANTHLKGKSREDSVQSGGEEELEEDPHTPLPPPMEIIKDSNNPEDSEGSNQSDTEQKNKAMRGRMFVVNEMVQTEKDYVKDLGVIVEVRTFKTGGKTRALLCSDENKHIYSSIIPFY
ncbi:kalirin-like, partial [Oncorhynchus kisutch]|uniref:kalirin-like n=1 Tax=Oncorhynchus kisutch TaxID=8019 RepID=UPI0012DD0BE7